MAVCLVIPARYDSARLPGKALSEIGGLPLVAHVARSVMDLPGVERALVATDDERVAAAVRAVGGEARLTSTRPRNGTERTAEIAGTVALEADVFVNVQGDQLGVTPRMVGTLVRALLEDEGAAMSTLAYVERGEAPATRAAFASPHVVKVVTDGTGRALYFSRAGIPQGPPGRDVWLRHLGLYAYRRDALLEMAAAEPTPLERAEGLEQLRALELGLAIRVALSAERTWGVDTVADLAAARERLLHAPETPNRVEV